MGRIAIIDIGTNTFNLLITELYGQTSNRIYKTKISVKLGEGGIEQGIIAPAAFERGVEALRTYQQTVAKFNVQKTFAFATSAVRTASNGEEFITKVKQETGIQIQMISGDKEAELIYYGVRNAVKMSSENSLIIDIGGGSTEFIIANNERIVWKQSFLLGASRLLEKFRPSDPITNEELEAISKYILKELEPLVEALRISPINELIGSSGSFDSLAEMIAHRFYTPTILDNKTEYIFNLDDCETIYQDVIKSTKEDRIKMKGLIAMRVDMIVIASIIVNLVLKTFNIKKMRLSTYSLKEGVLWLIMNEQK